MSPNEWRDAPSALTHYTRPLLRLLTDPAVTEICLQRPGEVWIERSDGWQRHAAPWATLAWAQHFARLVATRTEQRVGAETPLLSAALPSGERLQFVLPPATAAGCVVLSVRRPTGQLYTLEDLAQGGAFAECAGGESVRADISSLQQAYHARAWQQFLSLAVRAGWGGDAP